MENLDLSTIPLGRKFRGFAYALESLIRHTDKSRYPARFYWKDRRDKRLRTLGLLRWRSNSMGHWAGVLPSRVWKRLIAKAIGECKVLFTRSQHRAVAQKYASGHKPDPSQKNLGVLKQRLESTLGTLPVREETKLREQIASLEEQATLARLHAEYQRSETALRKETMLRRAEALSQIRDPAEPRWLHYQRRHTMVTLNKPLWFNHFGWPDEKLVTREVQFWLPGVVEHRRERSTPHIVWDGNRPHQVPFELDRPGTSGYKAVPDPLAVGPGAGLIPTPIRGFTTASMVALVQGTLPWGTSIDDGTLRRIRRVYPGSEGVSLKTRLLQRVWQFVRLPFGGRTSHVQRVDVGDLSTTVLRTYPFSTTRVSWRVARNRARHPKNCMCRGVWRYSALDRSLERIGRRPFGYFSHERPGQ